MPDQFNDICLVFIKQIIYDIIMSDDFLRLFHVFFNISFNTTDQHDHRLTRHLFDIIEIQYIRLTCKHACNLRNIRCMVSDSLHICHHLHSCGNHTQILCHWLLLHQQIKADIFNLLLFMIHIIVGIHNLFCKFRILINQCIDRFLNRILYHGSHIHHFLIKQSKLLVEF